LNGGGPGSLNEGYLNRGTDAEQKLTSNEGWNRCRDGETLTVLSAGGGGWGDALERDPSALLDDVRNGMVSVKKARDAYGVVVADGVVDEQATHNLRAALREARGS